MQQQPQPQNPLDEFNQFFAQILTQPPVDEGSFAFAKRVISERGIAILNMTDAPIQVKEEIVVKLLFLSPNDDVLLFCMGNLYIGINIFRAIMWLRMAHERNKENVVAAVALIKALFESGCGKTVFPLVDDLFAKFPKIKEMYMNNAEFLGIYSRCNFQQLKYENGIPSLKKLISMSPLSKARTPAEKEAAWANHHDIGYVYCAVGEIDLAIEHTRIATKLAKDFALDLGKQLLSFQNLVCYLEYRYTDHDAVYQEHVKINDYYVDRPDYFGKNGSKDEKKNGEKNGEKIRIGYVSSDYLDHPVSNFILPILENHSREIFEIYLFANQKEIKDLFTDLEKRGIAKIHFILEKTDLEVAKLVHRLGIDILVDLNGHTVSNRLGIFSYHPAPVQMSYLGYPNTTGLKSIQYRLTDGVADPLESVQKYSETLVRLPRCFLLYKSIHQAKPTVPRKTRADRIVLAALNKENKNSPYVLAAWAKIMAACPQAILLIKLESFDNNAERTAFYSTQLSVDPKRLLIVNKMQNHDYNRAFTMFDILLDPFPYSGTTTSCNALYNSVPIVTLRHRDYHAHSVTASILTHCGAGELVADTEDEYIAKVVELVNSPDRIDAYKSNLGKQFAAMMNPRDFMVDYEAALQGMV
jgi:predicted O-linked N-acetylglucosamine transferase (SPINDLY family)